MTRTKLFLLLAGLLGVVLLWALVLRRPAPPQVPFARVQRETLTSTLNTNGKAEPSEWSSLRAERQGRVDRVLVEKGSRVSKGALLAELDQKDARTALAAAEARLAQSAAELETVRRGGKPADLAEIENGILKSRLELAAAQRDYESLHRLQEKQAATLQETIDARRRVQTVENEIRSLERKRGALVARSDRLAAEARLREAQLAVEQARNYLERGNFRAPITGVVFDLPVRSGAWLSLGDLVASVGDLRRLRVRVYVDEPELGRVAPGKPVVITWDALPGRQWKGVVEKMPSQVVALNSRQVGEVLCTIENPDLQLAANSNVNAEIRSETIENGLTIPKEALRHEANQAGVFLLQTDRVAWRKVKLGASSVTRSLVLEGLAAGDSVALPTERPLRDGAVIQPVYP